MRANSGKSHSPFQLAIVATVWLVVTFSTAFGQDTREPSADRVAVQKRLEAVQKEFASLPADADFAVRERLRELEATCQYHLAAFDLLKQTRERLADARQKTSVWNGYPQAPPYSILLLDEVRETQLKLAQAELSTEAQLRVYQAEIESLGTELTSHQQAERRFAEAAEKSADNGAVAGAQNAGRLENLSSRTTAEKIARRTLILEILRAELDEITAKKDLVSRQLLAIGDAITFTRSDLDVILQQIQREQDEANRAQAGDLKIATGLDPLRTWRVEFLELKKTFWNSRFIIVNGGEAEIPQQLETLEKLQAKLNDWLSIADLRITGTDASVGAMDPEQLRLAVRDLKQMEQWVEWTLLDTRESSLHAGKSVLAAIGQKAMAIWDAELYLVEETEIVGGNKISVYRAITTGKLIRLAAILVVGFFMLRLISRRVQARVAKRGRISPAAADLAGKWAFGCGLFLLVLYGLHTVSIPLTIFAFLGGALAIGLGFGTQTLLKNFISGVILLFERPLKVGDVVEVAGITGTIKAIGIRASVIQHFDGIDTLVPNSILLENQLTNWTFSNTVIRHSISIGVAYGSPAREVARLLLAVASEHVLVKKEPMPEVRFEDFGENALRFTLLFWLDTRMTARNTLASDLRFMIDKAFDEAGIAMAFPQRDIHFDAAAPVRIELSRPSRT